MQGAQKPRPGAFGATLPTEGEGKRVTIDWARVREVYEAGEIPVPEIVATFGVTQAQIYWRLDQQNWKRRRQFARTSRAKLISRMLRVLSNQVTRLEDMASKPLGEQEVRILSNMSRSLDKLIDMDKTERKGRTRSHWEARWRMSRLRSIPGSVAWTAASPEIVAWRPSSVMSSVARGSSISRA